MRLDQQSEGIPVRPSRAERGTARRLHETCVELEVPFHDVDALGVVWHGHYYKYLELARTRLMRSRGLDRGEIIGPRYGFVVIESACRHIAPLRYGDRARISAWFRDVQHRIFVAYEVTDLTHERRAARAHTILVTTDKHGRMLLCTPRPILERLGPDGPGSAEPRIPR